MILLVTWKLHLKTMFLLLIITESSLELHKALLHAIQCLLKYDSLAASICNNIMQICIDIEMLLDR